MRRAGERLAGDDASDPSRKRSATRAWQAKRVGFSMPAKAASGTYLRRTPIASVGRSLVSDVGRR